MDVRFSPEQLALRDSAAMVVDRLGPKTVADLDDDERRAKLDAAVASSGWRELRYPEDDGTPLASGVEAAVVAEELGRGVADAAIVGPLLAVELRRLAGAPPADGIETVLLAPDLGALAVADGSPAPGSSAIDAAGATTALALIDAGDGFGLVSLPVAASDAGVDLTRPGATVIGPATPVDGAVGPADLTRWSALGSALASADLVGTMRGAIDVTREYASERRQYGVEIGSFQAVQHLLADAFVLMEGSHSATRYAAWAVDALPPDEARAAAAVAKAYSARAAREVCETAIQVHGGIGNTWECMAHVFLRRSMLSTDLFGGVGPSLDRVLASQGIAHDRKGNDHGLR